MSRRSPLADARLMTLLADRALFGLDDRRTAELQDRLARAAIDPDALDRLTALVALSRPQPEAPPPGLLDALRRRGREELAAARRGDDRAGHDFDPKDLA